MEKNNILAKLQDIFRDVLDNDEIELTSDSSADEIEEWDSLSHVQIVHEVEEEFGVKFTAYEITSWINVEEMVDCIAKKLAI
jgi:acyl carrier protein